MPHKKQNKCTLGPSSAAQMSEQKQRPFRNPAVRVGEWWEADAWINENNEGLSRSTPSAAAGSRPFGRRDPRNDAEDLARTNGHHTDALTSWGHAASWNATPPENKTSRRAAVDPPDTSEIQAILRGEGVAAGERLRSNTGQPAPHTTRAGPTSVPWARDDDSVQTDVPVLFNAITGTPSSKKGSRPQ
jgi:hypothetical protein